MIRAYLAAWTAIWMLYYGSSGIHKKFVHKSFTSDNLKFSNVQLNTTLGVASTRTSWLWCKINSFERDVSNSNLIKYNLLYLNFSFFEQQKYHRRTSDMLHVSFITANTFPHYVETAIMISWATAPGRPDSTWLCVERVEFVQNVSYIWCLLFN